MSMLRISSLFLVIRIVISDTLWFLRVTNGKLSFGLQMYQLSLVVVEIETTTVLPTKSDSGVMLCLQSYQDL